MDHTLHRYRKTKRPRRTSHLPRKILEAQLWTVFSLYVRMRDGKCLMGQMWGGCSGPLQAGHVIRRGHAATKWDERNVFAQCRTHNGQHRYDPQLYTAWYVKTFGQDAYDELVRRSRETARPLSPAELQRRIAYFEHLIRELPNRQLR